MGPTAFKNAVLTLVFAVALAGSQRRQTALTLAGNEFDHLRQPGRLLDRIG
jgi:hypothetical protein